MGRVRGGAWSPADGEITVHMDGGDAKVRLARAPTGRVTLIGPATFVATVRSSGDARRQEAADQSSLQRGTRRHAHRARHPGADRARRRHAARPAPRTTPRPASTSWRCWSTPPAPTKSARVDAAPRRARPRYFIGKGKAEELRELCLAVDADTVVFDNELTPGPAVQPGEAARAHRHRPHRGDPRHLRPERPHPRGQGPGRAGPAALPPAPAAPRRAGASCRQQARRHRHPVGPGETKLEVDRRRIMRRIAKLEDELTDLQRTRQLQRKSREPQRPGQRDDRRLHQRRQVDAAQPPHRRRRAGRGPAVRHARPDHAPAGPARWRAGAAHRHGRLRPPPAPRAGRGVQEHARGRRPRPTCSSTSSTPAPPIPRRRSTPCAPCWPRSAPTGCPSCSCSTRPTWRPRRPSAWSSCTRARSPSRPSPARASTTCCTAARRPAAGARQRRRAARPVRPGRRPGRRPPRGRGALDGARRRRRPGARPPRRPSAGRLAEFVVDDGARPEPAATPAGRWPRR